MNAKNIVIALGMSALMLSGAESAAPAENLVKDGEFSAKQNSPRAFGKWWLSGAVSETRKGSYDTKDFKSAPQSVCIESDGKTIALYQAIPALKPNTKYKVSFFMKLENVERKEKTSGATLNIYSDRNHWCPAKFQVGTQPWTQYEAEFTSGPNTNTNAKKPAYMLLYLMNASGKVWFDDVRLTEVK